MRRGASCVCQTPKDAQKKHEMEKKGTLGEVLDLIQEEEPSPEERTSCADSFRVDLDKSAAQLAGSRRRADSDHVQPSSERAGGLPRSWEKPDKGTRPTPTVQHRISESGLGEMWETRDETRQVRNPGRSMSFRG